MNDSHEVESKYRTLEQWLERIEGDNRLAVERPMVEDRHYWHRFVRLLIISVLGHFITTDGQVIRRSILIR